ncbi:MAG TPA: DUF6624 domain-containing protein [Planctomycetota bacterium]|nr:DUF6624 domain-containing protein [Planctomycetota bacterium]
MRRVLRFLVPVVALPPACRWTAEGKGEFEPRMGAWRALFGKEAIALEADRVIWFRDGELLFYRARHDRLGLFLEQWGRRERVGIAINGSALSLRTATGDRAFTRATGVPGCLVLPRFDLGPALPLPEERIREIREELARRSGADQAVRKDPARRGEMEAIDKANTAFLKETVGRVGWIDAPRFGREAAGAAFLLVQHSGDLSLMAAALPAIEEDVRAHRVDPQDYALLFDRLQISMGRRQRYGSQIGQDDAGRPVVLPLEDRSRVDAQRGALGLIPLQAYLEALRNMFGWAEVGFLEDA